MGSLAGGGLVLKMDTSAHAAVRCDALFKDCSHLARLEAAKLLGVEGEAGADDQRPFRGHLDRNGPVSGRDAGGRLQQLVWR